MSVSNFLGRDEKATTVKARVSPTNECSSAKDQSTNSDCTESTKELCRHASQGSRFVVGNHVFLKVAPMRGVMRFWKKGKLSPRFIGPFDVLERVGPMANRLALPPALAAVHNVFHVSILCKYTPDPSHVIDYANLPLRKDLSYEEEPIGIVATKIQKLRNKEISLVNVVWNNHRVEEPTWELESERRAKYPVLFWD